GNLSGATIGGFGLPSGGCTGTANKLTWDSATGKFVCAADQNTASSYTAGQGLTLNGSSFKTNGTLTGSLANFQTLSGNTLRVSAGGADIQGALAASGSVRTDGDLTLNDDQTAADAILTFGQPTTNQTLKYLNAAGKFQFSRGLSVLGTLSGSSLNVDRNATVGGTLTATGAITTKGNLSGNTLNVAGAFSWRGISYNGPTSQTAGGVLKTDGAGNLIWAANQIGSGSGNSLSFQPQYPNSAYFASGSTVVGQLTATGGTAGRENVYRWTSSKTAKNDYWIGVRVRVPDNFSSWINTAQRKPIELRYRTGSGQSVAQSQGSYVTIKMTDTAGAAVALTGGSNLANTSYTTASITGPEGAGTWTKGGYFNIWVKLAASTTPNGNWFAEAGYLNISWLTTAP
ncbi:hypothetical protein HZA87_00570, partial [Candidatus Uhrbacteria bacterium]|nr:hypothetical protein [Candidatus Uhrbacteria bacterium]